MIFRAQREAGTLWVTAVFPTLQGTGPGDFTIYQHIGQHGTGVYGWYARTRPATRAEYQPLLRELRGIYGRRIGEGDQRYRLVVVKRMSAAHRRARREG